jgi:hypothetical protein
VEWISVKERYPEHMRIVIVYVKRVAFGVDIFYTMDFAAYYEQVDGEKHVWVSHEVIDGEVTHWMPRPEKPLKEVTHEERHQGRNTEADTK